MSHKCGLIPHQNVPLLIERTCIERQPTAMNLEIFVVKAPHARVNRKKTNQNKCRSAFRFMENLNFVLLNTLHTGVQFNILLDKFRKNRSKQWRPWNQKSSSLNDIILDLAIVLPIANTYTFTFEWFRAILFRC